MATHATEYWHTLEDGRVQCDVCPRACKLREGQQGLCFVRANEGGAIVLTSYGRSSGFCIDPIEKKPLNHFLPGTPVLSFGTAGCNLACKFCQNWDMSKSREMDTLASSATPVRLAEVAKARGCRSVAYTYNDPIIFMEYAIDTAIECHQLDIASVAVSAGYMCPEPRKAFFQHMDAANIDLKAFTERFYHKICGGDLASVLDTLLYLKCETNVWFEITTLLIPDENDSNKELEAMTRWIVDHLGPDIPLHFSAFHPDWKMLDKPRTPATTLTRARQVAMQNGLNFVYTGNVHDPEGSSTYCPTCKKRVIERDWYQLGEWALQNRGECRYCGTQLPSVFEAEPGSWGPRREPVAMSLKY
ncbi:AmmeMemoRadiSam system radical SAM enzyme [Oleiphilus messinensis]|uniref:AmmeMemoRadiSam system radical SAM enzyme n=1 Tax=Oleiphilus messinensis TaxID=141451 RepID=A0A1Y0IG59_9GAMM|nr:AmmeMemoRadiSam system radical SAM enzyme [Oleiphilus messinensis]ARU58383.1 AmmeMemoRadiSam system radical SAM enzyme [Oleiphilus messinensis]